MRIAFKEWAAVVDALGSGEQIVILRKGGIHEGKKGFAPEHDRFLLFPTLFHQQRESVVSSAQRRFDRLAGSLNDGSNVRIEFLAEVVEWRLLNSLAEAERLNGLHIWRDEVMRKRFEHGGFEGVYAMAVRVKRLPVPAGIPMLPSYGGCKSWIEIEREIEDANAALVMSDARFDEALRRFQDAVSKEGEVARP